MKPTAKQGDLNGFLDRGSHLRGELQFDTHFRVHGKFSGEVKTEGELIVGEGGEVEGELRVGQVIVSGIVRGTIQASRRIQITATGKVFADVETPSLIVEDGATFEGRCSMNREAARAAAPAVPGPPKLVPAKVSVSAAREPGG
jgi:cytoskeletal protein CcmA (bactofilin family)